MVPALADDVAARLGLEEGRQPRIRFRFDDSKFGRKENEFWAWVRTEDVDAVRCQVVTVRTGPFVAVNYDLDYVLCHELAHCFQLAAFEGGGARVPSWVLEGLADWATGRGESTLLAGYQDPVDHDGSDATAGMVVGLDRGGEWKTYGESWLAIAGIEAQFGVKGVRDFCRGFLSSPDVAHALRRSTGLEWNAFVREARTEALARFRRDLADGPSYAPAKEALKRRDYAVALLAYDRFLVEHPSTLIRPLALAERAQCRMETGDLRGAQEDLAAIALPIGPGGNLSWMRRYLGINLEARRGNWEVVEREATLYLSDCDETDKLYTDRVYVLLKSARDEIRTGTHQE